MGTEPDILSHQARTPKIHILTLDAALADDVYERLRAHRQTKTYQLIVPKQPQRRSKVEEIEAMASETTSSRVLILDVRRASLPQLQPAYNKIVGYNRRDLNKLCYTLLIGDGPLNLFQQGKDIDVFVPHLAAMRVDYNPAVFFFDPFIHFEPDEIELSVDGEFTLPDKLPRRLAPYFAESGLRVDTIRSFFRAAGQPDHVRQQRLKILAALYLKRIGEQFPGREEQLKGLLSKEGVRLATEKMNLYPIFFEEWVDELMMKAANPQG